MTSTQDFAARAKSTWLLVPGRPLAGIERVLLLAWQILEVNHSDIEGDGGNRLECRLTYMTRSYRDHALTVAAWANRDQRRPPSLLKRAHDSRVYDNSVTADIYGLPDPDGIITSDATRPEHRRHFHIYPEEPRIILSHIAWPVLSPDSELLGTFVVDCNRRGLFREEERSVWQDFCEPFVEVLALEKLRLDGAFLRTPTSLEGPGPRQWGDPPF